jgi:tetratricopeptide (TPR) repeat protein
MAIPRPCHCWKSVLLLVCYTGLPAETDAFYYGPDIQTVPTARLIANLEKRLANKPVESDRVRPGEEIKIWSWSRDAPGRAADGTHTVDQEGFVTLPQFGKVQAAGRTLDELQHELTGGEKGTFVEQAWHQRRSRLLPGETTELHYELGRVYSIAYAQNPKRFRALKGGDRPFLGHGASTGMPPDRRRFRSDGPVGQKQPIAPADAKKYLESAIEHFKEAIKSKPDHLPAQLGLAWCLDQKGDKPAAIDAYRKALELAWAQEQRQDHSIVEVSWVEEIAGYLEPLLDPDQDAAEIQRIKEYRSAIDEKGRAITPILVGLKEDADLRDLTDPEAAVAFDLDGSGLNRRWGWITPEAAWLVYDPEGTGRITSGLQLFGNVTFWVFWNTGYDALSSLDDNGDGMLAGAELNGLALWQDENSNGKSETGEVRTLTDVGIVSLSCECFEHETGIPYNPTGAVFRDGTIRSTYDWKSPQTIE